MSLKAELLKRVKSRNGEIYTFAEVESLCKELKYKISNAERRLRELCDEGGITPLYHSKGYITGYKSVGKLEQGHLPFPYRYRRFTNQEKAA